MSMLKLFQEITLFLVVALFAMTTTADAEMTGQFGITFAEDTVGILGDARQTIGATEIEIDAQLQRTDRVSAVANASITQSLRGVGIKPFVAYAKNDAGNTTDAGALVNFSVGGLDIGAGASFRGADPNKPDRFDREGFTLRPGYNPETRQWKDANAYTLPALKNINAAFNTGFEWKKIETDLTLYAPLTKREVVPVVIISRSQASIDVTEGLSLALVIDARTYLHADGVELAFKPFGTVTYKWR